MAEEATSGGTGENVREHRVKALASKSTFASETDEETGGRDRWPSRIAFYLAAVGSAVGFGNVWRFPALAKDYGGGAFFIPYLLALFMIGLPVLILEISLGQVYQTGNIGVFAKFHPRMRGVGMASAVCAFMLVCYYSGLLIWVTRAFFDSFGDKDPWAQEGTDGGTAVGYFFNEIIELDTTTEEGGRPTRIVPANGAYGVLVWFVTWLCLAFGLEWTGRVAYFTMGLPILLLFLFLIKGLTLEGAGDGVKVYIGEWSMDVLTDRPDVWSTAVSQIFFSLSVTMGTMTSYGSHCPRGEPALLNSFVIGISNSMFSILSGFAVFAAMGHLAHLEDKDVNDIPYAGFSLVFGTWPVVFGTFPGGEHWVRLLFFNLFLLGIDSAFSILEGPLTVVLDYFDKNEVPAPKWKVAGIFCILAYVLALLIYATDAGLFFLDTIDWYINFVLLMVGFGETFGAGWMFGIDKQIESLGHPIVFTYMFAHFGSVIVASGLWFGLDISVAAWGGFVGLFVTFFVSLAITLFLCQKKMAEEPNKWTWGSILYELTLKNVMDLKDELQAAVGYMPSAWAFMMKNFIPQVLLILFVNLAVSLNDEGKRLFGNYGSYVNFPYQVLGILCVVCAGFIFVYGAIDPSAYEGADLTTVAAGVSAAEGKDADGAKAGEKASDEEEEEVAAKEPENQEEAEMEA